MASTIKVDKIEGAGGSTITIPSGQTFTITDGLAASTIGSGTLADARIPSLNASKITAGTMAVARGGTGVASLGSANQSLSVNSGASALEFQTVKLPGKETMWVPANAMYPNSTNGAESAQVELSNGPEIKVLDFDASSDENAQFAVAFPKSWNEGTITFQAYFTVTGTNTGTTAWGLSGVAISDNDSINTAFGTNVVATAKAHSGTSNDLNITAESGAVTIAGTPAVGDQVYFQVMRDVSADDQSGDSRLLGIKLFFTTDASTDA
ncbi:hypothetical protein [uncultured Mediterranean phage uvMED]|nr:hypothetical protein [uncultured Mediterranean phage uvMED]BAQ87524.1 hypothetical protein [uncultured Mediterranean phage uvMED]BAR17176.1 hypothetical protein [uncultured Mediterranean phage uvMED]BAR17237.1 hypothetical protein [uncultured Mediterranean phage uvMED]BAR17262.1 hypothetical protein [uncultured Mediterranean phage uvMED]